MNSLNEAAQRGAGGIASAQKAEPEIHRFLAAEQDQQSRLSRIMRGVEDLADRVCGAVPTMEEQNRTLPATDHAGLLGALGQLHNDRDAIIDRIGIALDRIERML